MVYAARYRAGLKAAPDEAGSPRLVRPDPT